MILPFPHVVLVTSPDQIVGETDRAIAPLDPLTGWTVEGSYSGCSAIIIMVRGPTP